MSVVILIVVLVGAMLLIPLGLPGTWVMVGAALVYDIAVQGGIGTVTVAGTAVLALIGELLEFSLAARYTRRYGGSRRAGWGAIVGGLVGAFVGVPVPVIGPVIGAFLGAFLGALAAEWTVRGDHRAATRVATGALLGRVAAAAMKVALGMVMAVWIVLAAVMR
ncbi:MAG TPA: DUF456 domain-containing protein [Gemmatimonadaceae bacterium]